MKNMRILKMLICTLPLAWAFAGCSEDGVVPDVGQGTDVPEGMHEVEVTFNMGANAGLQTRATAAPRPLESSDNWQRVTNMRIYVFRSETESDDNSNYTYYKPTINGQEKDYLYVSDFYKTKLDENGDISNIWGDEADESENEEHTVTAKLGLEDGFYKFLAVGRDDILEDNPDISQIRMTDPNLNYPEDYSVQFLNDIEETEGKSTRDFNKKDPQWTEDETTLKKVFLRSSAYSCSELFSGISEAKVHITQETKGFSSSITLNRAVAGILMYVKNVPIKYEAMASIPEYDDWGDPTGNGTQQGKEYVVSKIGICPSQYSRDALLVNNKDKKSIEDLVWDPKPNTDLKSYFVISDIDRKPTEEETQQGYYNGTFLAGDFVVPQLEPTPSDKVLVGEEEIELTDKLYLVFYANDPQTIGANGDFPIYWIPIKCVTDYTYNPDNDNYTESEHPTESAYNFSLDANSFYSLGKKNYATEEDEPIDLKPEEGGDYNLVITVNPDWDWKGELEWAD